MELKAILNQMQANAETVHVFLSQVGPEQAAWKPDPEQWSMVEVVCHLLDEEKLDFSVHVQEILEGRTWSLINPPQWVEEHGYAQRHLAPSLEAFLQARRENITWLSSLESADWQKYLTAPWGPLYAGDVLHSWLAHDFLHIRQLNELQYAYAAYRAQPYHLAYAGDW